MGRAKKYYFLDKQSETCLDQDWFIEYMRLNNLTELEVYKAEPWSHKGVFWCYHFGFCGDDTMNTCGKANCSQYRPRNGVSGVCKYHSHRLYVHGDKVNLKLQ